MPATETDFDFSGPAIRARREAIGMSREELALAVGGSTGTIISWERGDRVPRERVRPILLAALGLSENKQAFDVVAAFVVRSCATSGVPVKLEDEATAQRISDVLATR